MSNETPLTAVLPRSSRTVRPSTERTTSPSVAAAFSGAKRTARPTIRAANSSSEAVGGMVPTTLPWRITVIVSAIRWTSFSLWVMNTSE